jgi:hypothetical protein
MTGSVQDTWDKFERWAYRYKKVCHRAIKEMLDRGYSDFDEGLFLQKWDELNYDIILDLNLSESDLSTRISKKLKFLRGYLVDISFDGPEFMAKHSNFLTRQYPSKCNNSIGVWLEQNVEGEIEAGGYFGFQGFDVNFFCESLEDVDLASMRNILPFDRMFVRRPKGQTWDAASINDVMQRVKYDIEFDYTVKIQAEHYKSGELFSIRFTWEE